jgi:hypothetical protein
MGCLLGCITGPGTVGGFFLSSWFTMVFWGVVAPEVEIDTIGYPTAMVTTIGLWLVVAPLAAAVVASKRRS